MGQAQGKMDKKERKELKKIKKQELKNKKKLKKKKIKESSGLRSEENALQALDMITEAERTYPRNIGYEQPEKDQEYQPTSYVNTGSFTNIAPHDAEENGIIDDIGQSNYSVDNYLIHQNEIRRVNSDEFQAFERREFAQIHATITEESFTNDEDFDQESTPPPPSPFHDKAEDPFKEQDGMVTHPYPETSYMTKLDLNFLEPDDMDDIDSDAETVSEKHKEEELEKCIAMKDDRENFEDLTNGGMRSPMIENKTNPDRTSPVFENEKNQGKTDPVIENEQNKGTTNHVFQNETNQGRTSPVFETDQDRIKPVFENERNRGKSNPEYVRAGLSDVDNDSIDEMADMIDEIVEKQPDTSVAYDENNIEIESHESNTNHETSEPEKKEHSKQVKLQIHHEFRKSQPNTEILKNDYFQKLPDMYKLEIKDELIHQEIPKWYKKSKDNWSGMKAHGDKGTDVNDNIDHHKKDRSTKTNIIKTVSNGDSIKNVRKKNEILARSTPRRADDSEDLSFTTNLSTIGLGETRKKMLGEKKQRQRRFKTKNKLKPVKEVLTDSNQSFDKITDIENISKNSGEDVSRHRNNNNQKNKNNNRVSEIIHASTILEDKQEKAKVKQQNKKQDVSIAERKKRRIEIKEVERRLTQLRDNMQQWDAVDRMRVDLRSWLHDMQEEVDDLEKQPSKLHAEACEVDIGKLQGIREEVQARGPAVEGLLTHYRELTQHNPDLQDPVVIAVKEDWEELLGQIENLIEDREQALQAAKDLQSRENDMDDDLENYINALEKIESADVATVQKSAMMKTRKPCRSTQTPRGSAKNPNRSFLTGDSDGDSDDDHKFLFPPRPPGSRYSSNTSLKRKRGPGGPRSPSRQSRGSRPGSRFDNLKKAGSAAALESDSEESGYGETYYTMHASSFDNVLDNSVFGEPTPNTMRGTPIGLENQIFSDGESTVSYLSTHAFGANPEDLRDAMSQTPGHTSTQTPAEMWKKSKPRGMQTQTGSNTSLHSIGNQTRRSSGARADLLRNILFEVKGLKQQRGLDTSSYNGTDDDTNSVRSDATIKKETLQHVLHDMRELREADATGTAATQTVNEEGTQTSMKLFPEGDPIRNARLEKFKNLMDDVKDMKGSRPGTPASRSRASTRSETPVSRHRARTPSRMNTTFEAPVQNGFHPAYPQNLNMTAPPVMMNQPMPQVPFIGGRRMVTQDDLNGISQRLERLQGYAPSRRATPPPPPPQPQYVVPVYAVPPPPRRRAPRDDAYLSDESEYGDAEPPRRRRIQPAIENALAEASRSALQLKRMSKRMKDSLRDDMQYDFL